jgi:hypothetical protein
MTLLMPRAMVNVLGNRKMGGQERAERPPVS